MRYTLLSQISQQYCHTGFVDHMHLTSFPGESLQVPGWGMIMNMNTFYTPLNGSPSPYSQHKEMAKNEEKLALPKIDISIKPEPIPKSQTGFGNTETVLQNLNQAQKHKLEDNVYSAMTNPVIKIKKTKFEPASASVPKIEPIHDSEKNVKTKKRINLQTGNGSKKMKTAHKFNVI